MTSAQKPRTNPQLPWLSRLYHVALVSTVQTLAGVKFYGRSWYRWYYEPGIQPNFIKTYDCRPGLSIRIFFPKSFDQLSAKVLPTVFTIHGGGFVLGLPEVDDRLNRSFADMHDVLVVALDYRKAPTHPFPGPVHDVEALLMAAFEDESLPIDKNRTALSGYSAGGNLALAVSQLPSVRDKVRPAAVVPVYAVCDFTRPTPTRESTRYFKTGFGPKAARGQSDLLSPVADTFQWSYIPVGQDTQDPLLSPYFAPRDHLPRHLYFVSCEADQLCHETWCLASRLAGRTVPDLTVKAGQEQVSKTPGQLILDDEKFAFQHTESGNKGSVNWLLVPDQIHNFDHQAQDFTDPDEAHEAGLLVKAYQQRVGDWLHNVVWK